MSRWRIAELIGQAHKHAGNLEHPLTYLPDKEWVELERLILAEIGIGPGEQPTLHQIYKFPTLDGQQFWHADFDMTKLPHCDAALASLKQCLNRMHRHDHKAHMIGLLTGVEAYLEMVRKGTPEPEFGHPG